MTEMSLPPLIARGYHYHSFSCLVKVNPQRQFLKNAEIKFYLTFFQLCYLSPKWIKRFHEDLLHTNTLVVSPAGGREGPLAITGGIFTRASLLCVVTTGRDGADGSYLSFLRHWLLPPLTKGEGMQVSSQAELLKWRETWWPFREAILPTRSSSWAGWLYCDLPAANMARGARCQMAAEPEWTGDREVCLSVCPSVHLRWMP